MIDPPVPLYRFPTTTLVVDDDAIFLQNFALQLHETYAYRLFDTSGNALEHIQRRQRRRALHERCLHTHREAVGWPMREHFVRVDLTAIEEEVRNAERFREVAVAVVDYAMPEMDGLQFCEQLANTPIRKVLLTGVADEKIAVSAFNRGLIDRFIRKHERNVADEMNAAIAELEGAYFREVSSVLMESVRHEDGAFLTDPAFVAEFETLRQQYEVVEHYYATEPPGFLMLDRRGNMVRLVVLDDEDMRVHREIAAEQGAPEELLQALSERRVIPMFWRTGGYYRTEMPDWRRYLLPARILDGRARYYMATLVDPPIYRELGWRVLSHERFLEGLDAERPAQL